MSSTCILAYYVILIGLTQSVIENPNQADEGCQTLMNTDFELGTYRITEGNKKYCIGEDIVFNPLYHATETPNTPFDSCFPLNANNYPGCSQLSQGPFALGFFAAITIEADNVEVDLENHEIKMDKTFYIQQRTFTIIEIGISPFITGQGPANFGVNNEIVKNTYIHDGILGLTSHSGLHSNHAQNITIENLRIYDFETAGIQFNAFLNLEMNNLMIGPSATQVLPCDYYSNGKFVSLAFYKMKEMLDDPDSESIPLSISFSGGRTKSINEIYDDLITSLDIAYRHFLQQSTPDDENNKLYEISKELYSNPMQLPHGSSIYGIILHSHGVGVGVDDHENLNELNGEHVRMSNIKISDLKLNVNEIPAVYFDACIDPDTRDKNVLKGPFGDVMDIRRMVGPYTNAQIIDLGDDSTRLSYHGNPLSDAQIALGIIGQRYASYDMSFGSQGQNEEFLKWALDEYDGESYDTLPSCIQFVCNGDAMFHTNKGIMGLRMDDIEDVVIENIIVKKLMNKSPLSSYACANYSGVHDGGSYGNQEQEGGMATDVKGIAITGGDTIFDGYNNVIQKLVSYNGDVIGLQLKRDAHVEFDYVFNDELLQPDDMDTDDDRAAIHIQQLAPGHEITFALLAELMVDQKYPYPNNFFACNILIENKESVSVTPYPPNGIDKVWCADYVPDNTDVVIAQLMSVDVKVDAADSENENTQHVLNSKDNINVLHTIYKYPNKMHIYFIIGLIGLICIIMVVFVLLIFILKCGKIIMNDNRIYRKRNKTYTKVSVDDTEDDSLSGDTDHEENKMLL